MNMQQKGFTMMEMIIVVILLGILAAYVVPRYFSLEKDARRATVSSFGGILRVASEMVHSTAVARTINGGDNVTMGDGRSVTIGNSRYPVASATGIINAIANTDDLTISYGTNVITFARNGAANGAACSVVYNYNGDNNTVPTVTINATDCS